MIDKFEKYDKQLQKLAWSFANTTGLDREDLYGEACLSFVEAVDKYTEERGTFTTFLWTCVRNSLVDYCHSFQNPEVPINEKAEFANTVDEERKYYFRLMLQSLPEDVQNICRLVLDAPHEYAMHKPRAARGVLVKQLRNTGWIWSRIWDGMRETKHALNEM